MAEITSLGGVHGPEAEEASAVLDEAHVGDIQGAFGTIRQHDLDNRRSWAARILTLLAIMGPGLIVMVGRQRRRRGVHLRPGRARTSASRCCGPFRS